MMPDNKTINQKLDELIGDVLDFSCPEMPCGIEFINTAMCLKYGSEHREIPGNAHWTRVLSIAFIESLKDK